MLPNALRMSFPISTWRMDLSSNGLFAIPLLQYQEKGLTQVVESVSSQDGATVVRERDRGSGATTRSGGKSVFPTRTVLPTMYVVVDRFSTGPQQWGGEYDAKYSTGTLRSSDINIMDWGSTRLKKITNIQSQTPDSYPKVPNYYYDHYLERLFVSKNFLIGTLRWSIIRYALCRLSSGKNPS